MMETKQVIRDRHPCPGCLRTINPDEPDPELSSFVACDKCGTVYHANCRAELKECQHRVTGAGYACGETGYNPITIAGRLPVLPVLEVKPHRFKGLNPPLQPSAPNVVKIVSASTKPSADNHPRSTQIVSAVQRIPARLIFAGIGSVLAWTAYNLPFSWNLDLTPIEIQNALGDYVASLIPSQALLYYGFGVVFLTLACFILQQTTAHRTSWLAVIASTVFFTLYIFVMQIFTPNGNNFLSEYDPMVLLSDGVLGLAFVLPAILSPKNNVGRLVTAGLLIGIALPITLIIFASLSGLSSVSLGAIISSYWPTMTMFGLGLGVLPWLPEVLFFRNRPLIAPDLEDDLDEDIQGDTTGRLLARTVVLGAALAFGIALSTPIFIDYSRYVGGPPDRCDIYSQCNDVWFMTAEALVLGFVSAFVVNLWVIRPSLDNPPGGYWRGIIGRVLRVMVICGAFGGMIGVGWYLAADTFDIDYLRGFPLSMYVLDAMLATIGLGLIVMTSVTSGYTRLGHVFRGTIWMAFTGLLVTGLIVATSQLWADPLRLYAVINAIRIGILLLPVVIVAGSLFLVIPMWFVDWIVRRGKS